MILHPFFILLLFHFWEPLLIQESWEDQEGQHHCIKGDKDPQSLGPTIVRYRIQSFCFSFFINRFFLSNPGIIDNHSKPMEEPISDRVPGHSMPEAHDQHINNVGNIWGRDPALEHFIAHQYHHETHKDKITEPER